MTVQIVASLTRAPEAGDLASLPGEVTVLEVRADRCGDVDPNRLRAEFPGRLLYTLRSHREGGQDRSEAGERHRRMLAAAESYDLVDLEAQRDLEPELLSSISPERRIVSWHGRTRDVEGLVRKFLELAEVEAGLYKMVPFVRHSGEEIAALQLLAELGRDDVAAFAAGPMATWSRHVAVRVGAPWIYGSAGTEPAAPGQPTVASLVRDYGYPALRSVEALFGVTGHPVHRSLSPRLHNAAYRELDLPYLYLAFDTDRFADFWLEVVEEETLASLGMPLRGLSVTTPYKAQALSVAAAASPLADRIGGANTLIRRPEGWGAENTDAEGVVMSIEEAAGPVAGRTAVVVGAGRAGRAGALGLSLAGAEVTVANRNPERGQAVAEELGIPFVPLAELDPSPFEIVLQATTLGRDDRDPLPLDPERLAAGSVVADYVYSEVETPLLAAARERGLTVVDGREILLAQARRQFQLMTGRDIPEATGRAVLGLEAR